MKPKTKLIDRTLVLTTLVCILPILFSLSVYDRLPEQVPIHFDASGNPDNYAHKAFAAFGIPLLLALFNLILQLGLKFDPKRDAKSRIYHISRWIIASVSLLVMPITLLIALGNDIPVERVVPLFVSLLFLILGNYLPKCRQNYTIGIKLPWTLASEYNWNRTHRFTGWLWTAVSIALLAGLLLNLNSALLFMIAIPLLAFLPIIYSFVLSFREPDETP